MACQKSEMNVLCDLGLLQRQHLTISIEHESKITSLEIYVFYMLHIIKDIKIYAILLWQSIDTNSLPKSQIISVLKKIRDLPHTSKLKMISKLLLYFTASMPLTLQRQRQ